MKKYTNKQINNIISDCIANVNYKKLCLKKEYDKRLKRGKIK